MSRRLMLRNENGATPILPSEYQQVEWIKPTNVAGNYIQLPNFYFNGADVFRAKIKKDTAVNSEKALFMARLSNTTIIEIGFTSNNLLFAYSAGGSSAKLTGSFIYGQWMDVIATLSLGTPTKKIEATIGGVQYYGTDGSGANTRETSNSVQLLNNPSNNSFTLDCELSFAQLDGKFSAYPCYRKSDSVIGVYDLLSNTFFPATGTFSKGADVN